MALMNVKKTLNSRVAPTATATTTRGSYYLRYSLELDTRCPMHSVEKARLSKIEVDSRCSIESFLNTIYLNSRICERYL